MNDVDLLGRSTPGSPRPVLTRAQPSYINQSISRECLSCHGYFLLRWSRRSGFDGVYHELLAWGPATDRRGWLCHLPEHDDDVEIPEALRAVWTTTGGIVEHIGEAPDPWWWLNCGDVLTREVSGLPLDQTLDAYEWMWADEGHRMPIAAEDYVAVAEEANGNLTLAHRGTGQVVWFAPDHFTSGVTVLPGCPEYTMYTFDGAPDLASWIEMGAAQWAR